MEHATRRNFLAIAGAGTAVAAAATLPTIARDAAPGVALPSDAAGPMAAFVHDVRQGEMTLMIEGEQVVVTDRELVARLAAAFSAAR